MPVYTIDGARSRVVTRATSSIHDTTTTWDKLGGTVEADPDSLEETGARATVDVDMLSFDAGDWLKNRKLKKDLDLAANPKAQFELAELSDVVREGDDRFSAKARGVIRWRGREAEIEASGSGTIAADRLEATATFDLDVTRLGVKPPRFLMFKVADVVTVEVTVVGRP